MCIRRAFAGGVEMHADERDGPAVVRDLSAPVEGDKFVFRASHSHRDTPVLQLPLQAASNVESGFLFNQPVGSGTPVMATVPRIHNDKRPVHSTVGSGPISNRSVGRMKVTEQHSPKDHPCSQGSV